MADQDDIGRQVNHGLAWVGAASSAVAALDLVAHFVILSLWIDTDNFGAAVYALMLFPVLDIAADLGLTAAVIQRDDHTPAKVSTLFWLNFGVSALLAVTLAAGVGPLLAWFFHAPIVAGMLGLYGLKLLWQNVYYIPYALMKRELRFKEISVIRMLANLAEFLGKVGFAWAGFGPWCYIAGPLCRVAVTGVGIQLRHPWRPQFVLQLREARDWLMFGVKASSHKMLFHLYTSVDYFVVGAFFGNHANGVYANAYMIVLEPCRFISEVVQNIAFPLFSRIKYDRDQLVEQFVKLSRMNLVVVTGFLGVVFVGAEDILRIMDPQWVEGTDAVRVLCVVGVLRALSFVAPPLLDGTGHPGKTLIYTAVAAVVVPGLFVLSAAVLGDRLGFMSVAWAWAAGYPIAFAVLFAMALGVIELPATEYIRRVIVIPVTALVAASAAAVVAWFANDWPASVRVAAVAVTMLGSFSILLARFAAITPGAVRRALAD